MTEKQLQAAVEHCARALGWKVYHTHDSRRSEPGYPDLTLCKGRRLVFAELKTDGGRVSDAQWAWLAALRMTDAEVFVWRCADWLDGEVERVLMGEGA